MLPRWGFPFVIFKFSHAGIDHSANAHLHSSYLSSACTLVNAAKSNCCTAEATGSNGFQSAMMPLSGFCLKELLEMFLVETGLSFRRHIKAVIASAFDLQIANIRSFMSIEE